MHFVRLNGFIASVAFSTVPSSHWCLMDVHYFVKWYNCRIKMRTMPLLKTMLRHVIGRHWSLLLCILYITGCVFNTAVCLPYQSCRRLIGWIHEAIIMSVIDNMFDSCNCNAQLVVNKCCDRSPTGRADDQIVYSVHATATVGMTARQ